MLFRSRERDGVGEFRNRSCTENFRKHSPHGVGPGCQMREAVRPGFINRRRKEQVTRSGRLGLCGVQGVIAIQIEVDRDTSQATFPRVARSIFTGIREHGTADGGFLQGVIPEVQPGRRLTILQGQCARAPDRRSGPPAGLRHLNDGHRPRQDSGNRISPIRRRRRLKVGHIECSVRIQVDEDDPVGETGVRKRTSRRIQITDAVAIDVVPDGSTHRPRDGGRQIEVRKVLGHRFRPGEHRYRLRVVMAHRSFPTRGQDFLDFVIADLQIGKCIIAAGISQRRGFARVR